MASPGFVLEQYRLLQEQHEELSNHLQRMRPRQTSASSVSTRSSSPSSPSCPPAPSPRLPSRGGGRLPRARSSGWRKGPCAGDAALDTIVDEDTLCDISAQEQRLLDVNEGIKRALTELLNTDTVRRDSSMRMWAQARLMETEKELRSGRRRRSPHCG